MSRRDDFTDAYGRRSSSREDESEKKLRRYKRSYERHFEGYTVQTVPGRNGKQQKIRVYTGDIYRCKLSAADSRRHKLLYACALIGATALDAGSLFLPAASNFSIWLFALGCIPAALGLRLLFALSTYLTAPAEMKLHEYREGAAVLARFPLYAALSAIPAALPGPVAEGFYPMELLRSAMLAAGGLLTALVWLSERRVEYSAGPQ